MEGRRPRRGATAIRRAIAAAGIHDRLRMTLALTNVLVLTALAGWVLLWRPPDATRASAAGLLLAAAVAAMGGSFIRHADRSLRLERLTATTGRALAAAQSAEDVAEQLAEGVEALLRAAGAKDPVCVLVGTGEPRDQLVHAVRGADGDLVGHPMSLRTIDDIVPGTPAATFALPLMARERPLGVLVVATGRPVARFLDHTLKTVAAEAALALEGISLRESLEHRQERLATLLANSSDVIAVLDADLRIRFCSTSARQFGWDAEAVQGRPFGSLVHALDRPAVEQALVGLAARTGDTLTIDWRADGGQGWRHVETVASNLLHDPLVEGILLNSRDMSERKQLEEQLALQALHDPLTGLANRTLFEDRVTHALARWQRGGEAPVVAFLDLDNFKHVNDARGHQAGDAVLVEAASRLGEHLRPSDTAARLGGDEFAVLLEDLRGAEALEVAQRLLDALVAPHQLEGQAAVIGASIGLAAARAGWHVGELMRAADAAMYAAKSAGKGCLRVYDDQTPNLRLRGQLFTDLQHALERDELRLVYQPLVQLRTRRLIGVEALLRWDHPTRGVVGPTDFVPLAEDSGLIVPIGDWVLEQAALQLQRWRARLGDRCPPSVSVNVSPVQLRHPRAAERIAEAVQQVGGDPSQITLEITESALIEDLQHTIEQVQALKRLGFRLSVDDFGAGFAGLGYLHHLPVDELKIDRSYIEGLQRSSVSSTLVEAVLDLGSRLGISAVAEGIEQLDQANALERLGCPVGQGYLFARPMSPQELDRLIGAQEGSPSGTGPAPAASLDSV